MPWDRIADLPPTVRSAYKPDCQRVWMRVANSALRSGKPEGAAFAAAHTAAKQCSGSVNDQLRAAKGRGR